MEIVKKLMLHMERAEGTLYRDELLSRMVEICAQNNYQHVSDFEWYVTVLAELTEMETSAKHGECCCGLYILRRKVVGSVKFVRINLDISAIDIPNNCVTSNIPKPLIIQGGSAYTGRPCKS